MARDMTVKTAKRWMAVVLVISFTMGLNALIVGEGGFALIFGFFFVVALLIYGSLGPERVIVERSSLSWTLGQCDKPGPSGARCTHLPDHGGSCYDANRQVSYRNVRS